MVQGNLAEAHIRLGRFPEAAVAATKAVDLSQRCNTKAYHRLARALRGQGRNEDALRVLRLAISQAESLDVDARGLMKMLEKSADSGRLNAREERGFVASLGE